MIAGVLMFAFIGLEGDRTDVLAPTTGFLAGLLLGGIASGVPQIWLTSERVQWIAALTTGVIVVASWLTAC